MIPFEQALQIVLDAARPLGSERIALGASLGRVLAQEVTSDIDMPPFDKATVDGYACRRVDLGETLTVVETIPAGAWPAQSIGPKQCAKIMTGAPVPPGADCVVMVEQTENVAEGLVRFAGRKTADHIGRKAEDMTATRQTHQNGATLDQRAPSRHDYAVSLDAPPLSCGRSRGEPGP